MIEAILNRWEMVPALIDRLLSSEAAPATWQRGLVAGAVWLFRVGLFPRVFTCIIRLALGIGTNV